MAWFECTGGSGSSGPTEEQITDISNFTKNYSTSIPFGNSGARVATALGLTDEFSIIYKMAEGWNSNSAAFYDLENQIGAYAGYIFDAPIHLTRMRLFLGKFSGQNTNLTATIQYLDSSNNWNDLEDVTVATNIYYPVNKFDVDINESCYGIRWIHKKTPNKTSGNNITFFGMTLYKSQ